MKLQSLAPALTVMIIASFFITLRANADSTNYSTGCIHNSGSSLGKFYRFRVGTSPTSPCTSGDSQVSYDYGDITSVIAGTGLTGGASQGDATVSVANGGITTALLANNAVTAAKIGSEAATNGQVLTADGSGNASWQTPSGSDGWFPDNQTWTYASSNSITISGDETATYNPGTRVKATNNATTYYGTVANSSYSSGTTTVTLIANSDYSLSNSSITNTFYSYAANPQGYPGWFNYAPTYGGFSTPPGTSIGRFSVVGRICTIQIEPDTGGTSNSTNFTVSLPVAAGATSVNMNFPAPILAADNGSNQLDPGAAVLQPGSTTLLLYKDLHYDGWTPSGVKTTSFSLTYGF